MNKCQLNGERKWAAEEEEKEETSEGRRERRHSFIYTAYNNMIVNH